jgi:hypothetical protein
MSYFLGDEEAVHLMPGTGMYLARTESALPSSWQKLAAYDRLHKPIVET